MSTTALAHTFRDIDIALGLAKGTAFRAFKTLLPKLQEDIDYTILDDATQAAAIRRLRDLHRLYPSSVRAVVLSSQARALIEDHLRHCT